MQVQCPPGSRSPPPRPAPPSPAPPPTTRGARQPSLITLGVLSAPPRPTHGGAGRGRLMIPLHQC
ncbi:hypothetical protein E2C01_090731 [Portunus trituberculatus]|uniref:Uncharacterized protein n=1 Tax=Portunus trituberculatus TaxID=210409 RepID=A0A5B7JMJ3_PORTR|nr:hypothetical protein [Portunus trituberculatus]